MSFHDYFLSLQSMGIRVCQEFVSGTTTSTCTILWYIVLSLWSPPHELRVFLKAHVAPLSTTSTKKGSQLLSECAIEPDETKYLNGILRSPQRMIFSWLIFVSQAKASWNLFGYELRWFVPVNHPVKQENIKSGSFVCPIECNEDSL